jgi:hypothetical protein
MNFAVLPPEAPAATDAIYQLLAVLADRAKTKAALAKVVAARDEAQAAAEKFGDLQIERAALQKQQAEFEAWTAAERRKIREALRQIDAALETTDLTPPPVPSLEIRAALRCRFSVTQL